MTIQTSQNISSLLKEKENSNHLKICKSSKFKISFVV